MKNESRTIEQQPPPDDLRKSYEPPELRRVGHMAAVTQKSGGTSDGAAARKA